MTILLLGSGGREHAFAWKMLQSSHCTKLFIAPGNAGTETIATNVNLSPTDFDQSASSGKSVNSPTPQLFLLRKLNTGMATPAPFQAGNGRRAKLSWRMVNG